MSLDLNKLSNKLDEALSKETIETLTKFLIDKRMNNKQSSIEWLQSIELERDLTLADWNKAKAMHREEVTSFTADWSIQWKYEDGKSINNYYNETFNQNK